MKKRNRVYQKIENDFKKFEDEMLSMSAEEIYEKAYKISYIRELYDFLIEEYELSEKDVKTILAFKGNILEQMYEEWIYGDYSTREEYDCIIDSALLGLQKAVKLCA